MLFKITIITQHEHMNKMTKTKRKIRTNQNMNTTIIEY